MAIITASFQKCGSFTSWIFAAVKVAVSHAVRHQLMTPQQQQESTAGMLATVGIPAATGTPALSQVYNTSKRRHDFNSKNATNIRICVEKL